MTDYEAEKAFRCQQMTAWALLSNCMANLFSVDAETDDLYGPVWAIGAVVLDEDGVELDRYAAQIEPADFVQSEWVTANIVPVVNLPLVDNYSDLLGSFWEFWIKHRESSLCLADFGAPVEAGLFRSCIDLNRTERQWLGPYPMHELGTALLLAGIDPDVNRRELAGRDDLTQHDPVDDALAAALCWRHALGKLFG